MIESRKEFYGFLALFCAASVTYMTIAYKAIGKILGRRAIMVATCILLSGCATMTYEAPDGTKVTYSRVMTGADKIKAKLPTGASVESQGQKALDPAILEAILGLVSAAR